MLKKILNSKILAPIMPFILDHFSEILFRLVAPSSPFFRPLIKTGTWLAVICAAVVNVRNQVEGLGVEIPFQVSLGIEILGWVSGAIAGFAALTLDNQSAQELARLNALNNEAPV